MPWTKRDLITSALEEAGLAAFVFDLDESQLVSAGKRLDAMMASLNQRGLQIGYNMASVPGNIDIDADSGLPDCAYELVITGLAVRLAPMFGKVISPDTKAAYSVALNAMMTLAAHPQSVDIPQGYPIGAGYKATPGYFSEFTPDHSSGISAGDQPLEFE